MGKVDPHLLGYRELKLHTAYLELDTNKSTMTWLNHAYLLPSYPCDGGLVRVKEDFLNIRR